MRASSRTTIPSNLPAAFHFRPSESPSALASSPGITAHADLRPYRRSAPRTQRLPTTASCPLDSERRLLQVRSGPAPADSCGALVRPRANEKPEPKEEPRRLTAISSKAYTVIAASPAGRRGSSRGDTRGIPPHGRLYRRTGHRCADRRAARPLCARELRASGRRAGGVDGRDRRPDLDALLS